MKERYTVTALTENSPGVLHRLTAVFTRRGINIESLTVSETEREGVSRFTVVFFGDAIQVEKLVLSVRRIVEVIDAFASVDGNLLFKEIAFLRIGFENKQERDEIEQLAVQHEAEVVMTNGKTLVVEKTGKEDTINAFRELFKDRKLVTFIRSGRIAVKREIGDQTVASQYQDQ